MTEGGYYYHNQTRSLSSDIFSVFWSHYSITITRWGLRRVMKDPWKPSWAFWEVTDWKKVGNFPQLTNNASILEAKCFLMYHKHRLQQVHRISLLCSQENVFERLWELQSTVQKHKHKHSIKNRWGDSGKNFSRNADTE